jgi:hypothetical protein
MHRAGRQIQDCIECTHGTFLLGGQCVTECPVDYNPIDAADMGGVCQPA